MKEQQLQKRLNEICFPDCKVEYLDPMYEWDGGYILVNNDKNVLWKELLPISLEFVLKAAIEKYGNVETIPDSLQVIRLYIGNLNAFNWTLLLPFIDQPTETKDALYKIFEIE